MTEQRNTSSNTKKLYRSRSNRVLGGVCGGIGEYFGIDPLIIRLAWIVFAFTGFGIIAYIAALIIVPDNPSQEISGNQKKASGEGAKLWGSALIIIGVLLLLRQTGVLYYFHFWNLPWTTILALLLIGFGIYMFLNRSRDSAKEVVPEGDMPAVEGESDERHEQKSDNIKSFYRLKGEDVHMLSGVCTGLADYFDLDVTLVRLLWVFATLASAGVGIIAYIVAAIVFPEKHYKSEASSSGESNS